MILLAAAWMLVSQNGEMINSFVTHSEVDKVDSKISIETSTAKTADPVPKESMQVKDERTSWTPPTLPSNLVSIDQNNEELIKHIKEQWILPPFEGDNFFEEPYKEHYSQRGQSEFVDGLLGARQNGFFVEVGSSDGELFSNSLFFEKIRKWKGILIEPEPHFFKTSLEKPRLASVINACVSPEKTPAMLEFKSAEFMGGLSKWMPDSHNARVSKHFPNAEIRNIQCFPLVSIVKALGITHIDMLSIDINGPEPNVLDVFPFDEITVEIIVVAFLIPKDKAISDTRLSEIQEILVKRHGYEQTGYKADDAIFQKVKK